VQLLSVITFYKVFWQIFLQSLLLGILVAGLVSGCVQPVRTELPTPLPTEYLPTAIALTLEASGFGLPTMPPRPSLTPTASSLIPSETPEARVTETPAVTNTLPPATETTAPPVSITTILPATLTLSVSTEAPTLAVPLLPLSATPAPEIPDAQIRIYRLGERSLVTSPIDVSLRSTSEYGKIVRIELWGEDGRLLARDVRTYDRAPWKLVRIDLQLEFEISGAAEEGRLVISIEDPFGRLIDVNSVNLILLSQGIAELNPATALLQRIIIREPSPQALIQGGKLIVSGRARPNLDQPLKLMLVSEDGKVLGQRLAGVEFPDPGNYGTFVAEVPYTVTGLTPALLIVYEDGGKISQIAHLASMQVMLAP
jgi:hypothetical protein